MTINSTRDFVTGFSPIELAITLPKGFAREYQGRDWFNQIYFGMLSQSQESEGYKPILYKFIFDHQTSDSASLPKNILLTFYYPDNKLQTSVSGISIIGGQPEINDAYETTKQLVPYLESLYLDKHKNADSLIKEIISEKLSFVSNPISIKPIEQILEGTVNKKGDQLKTFYPILAQSDLAIDSLSIPETFRIDAVFRFGISEVFFNSNSIGGGLKQMSLYTRTNGKPIDSSLALPLIIRWQPVYNDILSALKSRKQIFPQGYDGRILPSIIVFERPEDKSFTVLISNITGNSERGYYYNVALAQSGDSRNGKPLSHLQSALNREKFGEQSWIDRLVRHFEEMKDGNAQDTSTDSILATLESILDNVELTTNGVFDFGLITSYSADSKNVESEKGVVEPIATQSIEDVADEIKDGPIVDAEDQPSEELRDPLLDNSSETPLDEQKKDMDNNESNQIDSPSTNENNIESTNLSKDNTNENE